MHRTGLERRAQSRHLDGRDGHEHATDPLAVQ
jgi:hypothetical protein